MAIKEIPWSSNYICLTTDTKPTVNIPEGSTLTTVIFDTKLVDKTYIFHSGEWYQK